MGDKNKINENKMKGIKIDSVILHCSTGDQALLEKCMLLLERIGDAKPIETIAKKRIPEWKIRPGIPVGCKVTIRGKKAEELLKRFFEGVNEFKKEQFNEGFFSFGIKEYFSIPSIPYQRDLGILGFDVIVKLKRAGYRVMLRKRCKSKIPKRHRISKEETIEFFKNKFNLKIK